MVDTRDVVLDFETPGAWLYARLADLGRAMGRTAELLLRSRQLCADGSVFQQAIEMNAAFGGRRGRASSAVGTRASSSQ